MEDEEVDLMRKEDAVDHEGLIQTAHTHTVTYISPVPTIDYLSDLIQQK